MQKIPLNLQSVPVGVGVTYSTIDELITIVAQNLEGYIQANVTFIQEFASDPNTYQGDLIFNTTQRLWKTWDTGTGSYQAITQWTYGDTKTTFVAGDDVTNGWIVLDGREISAVQGISANQAAVLQTLFGVSGSLPIVTPLQTLQSVPQNGSFSNITNPAVNPPSGQIGALTFSNPPAQTEVQALASNAENLDESTIALQSAVAAVIATSELVINALNGPNTAALYAKIYCGPVS